MEKKKERLLEMILEKSFQYADEPVFKLVSGATSKFYFNCKPVMLDPEGKELIGRLIFHRIKGLGVTAVGGLELGSVPISGAVSLISQLEGKPIKEFIVRKEMKDHGVAARIEGELAPGDRVAVVDDVITTGGSTLKAMNVLKESGIQVVKVVVLVDRQEFRGKESIERYCPQVEALLELSEVMARYRAREAQGP